MILDELSRLERFRRVAQNHEISPQDDTPLPSQEIDHLRSQLNAQIYLESDKWMLPSWAHLTLRDINLSEEMITELANTSYNNWSNIGGVGAKSYGIVDSRGLLTARFDCGSIDFWLIDENSIIFPALLGKDEAQLHLVSTDDQLYEWKKHLESIEFNRLIYHVKKNENEFIYNEVVLRNHGLEEATITFFLVIRPMSVLGFEPIERIELQSESRLVFVNDYLSLILEKEPQAVIMDENCNRELPTALLECGTTSKSEIDSPSGQGMIMLRYEITLPPAGSESIFFVSPLAPFTKESPLPSIDPTPKDRDTSIGNWFAFADNRVRALFPEDVLDLAFSQATVTLVIQALSIMFPEDSDLASLDWKERIRILLALIRSGCVDVARQVADDIIERIQIPDGPLDTSIFSPILWGLLELSGYTLHDLAKKNEALFRRLTIGVLESVNKRLQPSDEELLQSYSMLDESMFDSLIQDLWDHAALESALKHFTDLKDQEMVQQLTETIGGSHQQLIQSYDETNHARWPRPEDPQTHTIEDKILELLSTVSLLRIVIYEKSFLEMLGEKISKRRIVHNLWKVFRPKEQYSSHLALRFAHFNAFMKKRERVEPLLKRAIEFLTEDYLLPDYVDIKSYGGSEGLGASITAASDLILLLRDMLVFEDNSNLVLFPGIPDDWFTSKRPLVVEDLLTDLGPVHLEIGASANQHQLEIDLDVLPDELEFHVPPNVPLPMVKAYGSSIVERVSKATSPLLRVVPHSNQIVLTFHR